MFLLVSGRHVGAHPDRHQHRVSIQISINLGKKLLCISCIREIAVTWILVRVFAQLPSFFSQVLIFILIYFELCDTENQQYVKMYCKTKNKFSNKAKYAREIWFLLLYTVGKILLLLSNISLQLIGKSFTFILRRIKTLKTSIVATPNYMHLSSSCAAINQGVPNRYFRYSIEIDRNRS